MTFKYKYSVIIMLLTVCLNLCGQTINYPEHSVLSSGRWYSVSISSDGIYKLSYNDFISMGATAEEINFDNISVFGNTGQVISEVNSQYTFSDLKENAVYVDKNNQYVLFYGQATSTKSYDAEKGLFSFKLHPYATSTKYYITFDKNIGTKQRIQSEENIPTQYEHQLSTGKDVFFYKRELVNLTDGGRNWMGEKMMSTSPDIQVPVSFTDLNKDSAAVVQIKLAVKSSHNTSFDISYNNDSIGSLSYGAVSSHSTAKVLNFYTDTKLQSVAGNINIHFSTSDNNSSAWLDNITVNYTRNLSLNNQYIRFFNTVLSPGKSVRYTVNNVKNNNYMVLDVTDALNVKSIPDIEYNNQSISFNVPADTVRTFIVLSGNNFASPVLGDTVANQDLHAIDTADFVIIYHKDFLDQAERLADIHRTYDSIKVSVVEIEQVFNEFSSGTRDFLAMREFIRMMYNKSKGQYPKNVLLFGDGTYDNKNILLYNNNFIPTYQSENDLERSDMGITSDDVLAAIDDDAANSTYDTLRVGIGRMPVNDTITANIVVDKCLRYISKQDLRNNESGDWRNAVMLTCDDADDATELYFINYAENIYHQIDETNPVINVQKVYQDAYKEYASSSGATYPDATNTINDRMNKGCLLFNYLGHGSPDHLSSERLVTITDINSWTNYNKLCLMITSTCDFNKFDMVDKQSSGEAILTSENGAGIGLIAATRKIMSNDVLNRAFHKFALQRHDGGQPYTLGEIIMHAKNSSMGYIRYSDRSNALIGDPALKMSLPTYNIRTLQVNTSKFDSISQTMTSTDTVRALSQVTVSGDITDFNGNRINDFNGKIQISLYDKKSIYHTLNNTNIENGVLRFEQQNNLLHKGETTVSNGQFTYTFVVPKDIAYNYGNGKLSYYAQNDSCDAAGYFSDFIIGGIDSLTNTDIVSRPDVKLFLNDSNFVSGGICDENPSLFAVIYDTIPINTAGTGLGHDIVARLDNAANTFILNDYYTTDIQDKNKGYITYPFRNLSAGTHTLTLKVWNIYNYSCEKTITFNVTSSSKAEYIAVNYPNPFRNSTNIELRYNQPDEILSAQLIIYSQTGAVVKQTDISDRIGTYTIGPIEWDGSNDGGGTVQGGLYFYHIIIKTQSGDKLVKGNKMIFLKDK
ncbi:MAG: type IX secretion system sortase PorU [Bacteroidales bacterium]|nr:type IX secretion system sortase PorU [Bacteroidales bacterium]